MKISALGKLLAMLIFSAILFTACESTTDNDDDPVDDPKPEAPTELKAMSLSDSEIMLTWTPSPSESHELFEGYMLYISSTGGGPLTPVEVHKDDRPYTVTDLDEGVIYEFKLVAKFTNGNESEGEAVVEWSPATRFEKDFYDQTIEVYEYTSQFGSGIDLFYFEDEENYGPKVLTVNSKADWNLGIDTRNDMLHIMPAKEITYAQDEPDPVQATEINTQFWAADDLDEVFDSEALNASGEFKDNLIFDLNGDYVDPEKGVVLIVRSKEEGETKWNYSKILVKRDPEGNWLQGSGENEYLEMEISFQRALDVPYAKFGRSGGAE
jgi:hypothetical protein